MGDAAGGTWTPAYIGLGSNLDDPVRQVRDALDELAQLPDCRLVARSRLYWSDPLGPYEQPRFVNAVAGLLTQRTAPDLLSDLKAMEVRRGRSRSGERWGPRTLDLDLLAYDGLQQDEAELSLPHPGIVSRSFVLYPLAEIAPHLLLPGHGTVAQLAAACDRRGLDLVGDV